MPGEFEQIVGVIGRWPECFPPGTLAALKSVRLTRLPDPSAVSISTDQARSRLAARTSAERLHRHRPHARKRVGRPFEHPGSATAAAMHISGMPNPYGITLDEASIRWAAAEGVSETIIAAVLLLHEKSVDEVAAKLTSDELGHVIRLVSRCPTCYPPGTLAALRSLRPVSERPGVSTSNHQPPSRRPGRISAKSLRTRAHARKFEHPRSSTTSATATYDARNGVTPTMGITTTTEPVRASTLRVRRHRQRRRNGMLLFTVEVPERVIEQAITRGLLKQEDRTNPWPVIQGWYAALLSDAVLNWLTKSGISRATSAAMPEPSSAA